MATNLNINEQLLEEAKQLGGHRTKRDTVDEALREYINRRKRLRIIDEFNTFDFDPEYNYKLQRGCCDGASFFQNDATVDDGYSNPLPLL